MPHPSGRPWIIAHRGASLHARENTIEAFRLAADLGADAVELDVRRTADGGLIVHHDATISGADRPIVSMSRSEVADLAPWVPTLDDAIAACSAIWVDVEVKNDPRDADWDPDDWIVSTISADHADSEIVVTSFNRATVDAAELGGLRTGWLIGRGIDPAEAAFPTAQAHHEFLLPHHSTLAGDHGEHIVEACKRAGVEIIVWTVDQSAEIERLAELGVGGIATNAPDVAREALS